MNDFQVDFVLDSINEEDDRFFFTAKSITKEFCGEKGMERLADDSPGKHLVWRHEHPIIPKFHSTHIYGRVLESKVDGDAIFSKYEVYGHTKDHLKARQIIKKRHELKQPISISMRYRQYGEDNPIHLDVVEHSLTPTPACKECVALDVLNESDNMAKTEEEIAKEIKELEDELTKKDKLLEELEGKVVAIEKKFEEANKKAESKDKELEETKTDKEKVTEQLLEFKDKLNEQTNIIEKLQEDIDMKSIEPILNSLIEMDGKDMEPIYKSRALEAYKEAKLKKDPKIWEAALEFFAARFKKLEGAVHAVTTDLDTTANGAQLKDKEFEEPAQVKARDSRAFANMPEEFFKGRGG